MISSGALLVILGGLLLAITVLILVAITRHAPRPPAAEALARGDLAGAAAAGAAGRSAEELIPAATAARHLGDLDGAHRLAERAVRADPDDGEAWIELALCRAHRGDHAAASEALEKAGALRADLAESVTLHRAWLALRDGDRAGARRLFDEVEVPLETKLRTDLGSGDAVFADWFQQAAELWAALGDAERAAWARREALRSAPESRQGGGSGKSPAV